MVVRLDESNKKNELLRNQIFSQDEKMKSLEQELVEFKTKIKNLTSTKSVVDNRSVSVSLKLKTKKVYIPPFKRNNKKNVYFARLDKGKSFDVNAKISKSMSKSTVREHNKSIFVLTCHLYGVVGHIRPNCFLLRQNQSLRLDLLLGILKFLNLFLFVTFVVSPVTFVLIVIN